MSYRSGVSRGGSTNSHRNDGSSAAAPATGSIHGADSKRDLASVAQQKAPPRPPSRSGSTTGPNTGKQPTQRTGPAQFTPAGNKPYSTPSTESLTYRPPPAGDVRPAAKTGDPSNHPGERGRSTQIPTAADPVSSRESSSGPSEGSSGSEASDDEDHAQDSANHGQSDASASLARRGSGGATATAGRRSQYPEETNPTVTPSSGGSSPIHSEDISTSESFHSGDSSQGSPGNTPEKPRIPNPGRGGPEDPSVPTRHPIETQVYGQVIETSGNPDTYSSTVTPHAPSVNLPIKIESVEDTGDDSAAHEPPIELRSLTDLGSECPAATEAVKYLFQAVGRDVVSFRRNTQVSYMVVERARDVVGAINNYIAKVENSVDGDWDSFEKFTVAIEPLEDILFKLLAFTEDEKARYFANTASIDDCVSSAECWASNRAELSRALEGFDTRQELVGLFPEPDTDSRKQEHQEAQIYDDRSLLEDMRNTIHNFVSEDPNRFPSYVRDVKTSLDKLQLKVIQGLPPDWLTVITIQTSMLVEGVMEMVKDAVLDPDILNHLKSRSVWKAASDLIGVLEGVDLRQPTLPQFVEAKYDIFVQALMNLGRIALPGTYVDLLKQAGRIRRPFQAQAFALIMLCRFLADKFTTLGDSAATVENVNSLEDAFDKTLVALQAATKAVTGLQHFDLTNFEGHAMVKAFGDAEALIRGSFKSFGLDAEWTQKQSELTAALNKDKERMAKLNDMLSRSPESATTKVDVYVSVHDKSPEGPQLATSSAVVEPTMRLLALRWNVASVLRQEDIKRARTASTFYKQIDGRWSEIVTSSSTLSEIVGGQSEVALRLVIT